MPDLTSGSFFEVSFRYTNMYGMTASINRRKFIKNTAIGTAALGMMDLPAKLYGATLSDSVRLAVIGTGSRGRLHMSEMMKRKDVRITAIADPDPVSLAAAVALTRQYGQPDPALYGKGDTDYKELLKRTDVDAVIIASPWEWHLPQTLDSLKAGKPVGLEVAGALKLQDCWDYVTTSEQTGVPVMILENVCYRRDIMAVLNMVQQNCFGELLHLQGGYQHDLRAQLFNTASTCCDGVEFGPGSVGSAKWRTAYYENRNAEIYPTHQLGPIATMLDINRGNRLTALSSIATKARGMNRYVARHPKGGPNHPNAKKAFKLGDIITTQLQTSNGETIVLTHDTSSPRPYNLGFRVQGTNGIWQETHEGQPERGMIYFEDKSEPHTWENPRSYLEAYDHPLWKRFASEAEGSGHGGMDFFVDNAFVEAIKRKAPFPLDVYDLATWYAITPLSETSISKGGSLVQIPDFTRGKWKSRASFRSVFAG